MTKIGNCASSCHRKFGSETPSFYDPGCVLRVGHKGAQRAADAAYDRSSPKSPNRMLAPGLPARPEFPADAALVPLAV